MSKSRSSNPADAHLSVTLAEALGEAKVAEVQAVVDGPAAAKSESLLKELVLGGVAMARMAGRAALTRVRSVFSRSRAT